MSNMQTVEAYSRLKALRQNVPDQPVAVPYITEFHQILDLLEKASGVSLQGFRIPQSEVRPVDVGGNYLSGDTYYSRDPYCDRSFFLMKVDGVLSMFEILLSTPSSAKAPIGFRGPKSSPTGEE